MAFRFLAGTVGGRDRWRQGQVEAGHPPKSESLGLEVMLSGMILPPEAADTTSMCDMFVDTFFSAPNAEASGICTTFRNKARL